MSIPVVKQDEKGIMTLYVHDRPFFCHSGEIHNSSSSDLDFLQREVMDAVTKLHLNSLIVPITWEGIEAVEGVYDFTLLDGLIAQARQAGLKLILLWFGLWKNSESMYVPGWMKRDTETYFRVEKVNGEKTNTISPLCKAAVEKDKKAFSEIMKHIKAVDEAESTVIVMQVENEIGVLGTERDYSAIAQSAFESEIPEVLETLYGTRENWRQAFGENAEEYFMAYYYGMAVEAIAKSGKAEYDLPCYANSWLYQYPWFAGSYPVGGPVPRVHKIWKAVAPSLFALAPDIYVAYCADVMDEYAQDGNPLFIPEIRKDAVTASYCMYAFFAKNAICYSPFGIEDLGHDPAALEKPPMDLMIALNIDPTAFEITGSAEKLAATYELMDNIEPLYLEYRGTDKLRSFVRHGEYDFGRFEKLEDYDMTIAYSPRMAGKPLGCLTVFELTKDRFLLVGMACEVKFRVKPGENKQVEFIRYEEGRMDQGTWKPGRMLNGDEKMSVRFGDMPTTYMIELYKY